MDFEGRLESLQKAMSESGIDLTLYGSCPNFQYLTGLALGWRSGIDRIRKEDILLVPMEGKPALILSALSAQNIGDCPIGDVRILQRGEPFAKAITKAAEDVGWSGGRLGIGENLKTASWLEVLRSFKGAEFCDGDMLLDHLRMIKEPSEIEALRLAARHTDQVIETIIPKITSGVTMRELGLEIELSGRRMGAEDVSFPPVAGFIRSGSQPSGSIYGYEMDEGLEPGTTIFFDLGFVIEGYSSDWGRSVYWGKAGTEVKEGYRALQNAVVDTVGRMKPQNMRVCDIFPSIEASLDKAGFGDYLRARLSTGEAGHQIGIEVHEDPWLIPENTQPLQKGMVMCIEPKLWHDGEYYLRVEDMVVVNENGAEFLTNFDRELFEL